jgi:hypothetical protein
MKNALTFAAVAEAATGLTLLVAPSLVGQLLLGDQLVDVAIPVARVAGVAILGLAIACWPGPPLVGMLTYSAATSVARLRQYESPISSWFKFSPKIRAAATFDFCNTIGT